MPITCPISVLPINQEEFAQLDYQVMRQVFDSHNGLGRLCDEAIYQNDLAARLQSAALGPMHKEVPVTVTHADFAKTYSLDLVVANAAVYELKTAVSLAGEHEAQLLNYLLLVGANHGKLVNFRPAKVESRFVNTMLTQQTRRQFEVGIQRWREGDDPSRSLRGRLLDLLQDWGCFLELSLHTEALVHFLGGEQKVVRKVGLKRSNVSLGDQRVHLLAPDTAFRLSALAEGADHFELQLHLLLKHSTLRAIQWINMARHRVDFVTLTK